MTESFKLRHWHAILILVATACLVYANTLDIPWYLDDYHAIVDNQGIHNFRFSIKNIFLPRGIPNLTFAFNYYLGGTNTFGYHLVNIALHLINSVLLFSIFRHLFNKNIWLALFGALIFLVHPVQTQSVNYIVQRSVLLSTFFAFSSIFVYIKAKIRLSNNGFLETRHLILYSTALLLFLLSVSSKQNTATLPAILLILDNCFLNKARFKENLKYIAPFFIIPTILASIIILLPMIKGVSITSIATVRELSNLEHLSPINYFATELEVIFTYLRLFIFPVWLKLDYAFPVATNVASLKNLCFLFIHILIISFSIFIAKKRPFFSLGVFWFYIALIVESTFIPLDPIFEHRLYFPVVGLIISICSFFQLTTYNKKHLTFGIILLLSLGSLTFARNNLWRNPIDFTLDNISKAPHSEGLWVALSGRYMEKARYKEALEAVDKAKNINNKYPHIYINSSSIYIKTGELSQALNEAHTGIIFAPNNQKLKNNLAITHTLMNHPQKALSFISPLLKKRPNDHVLLTMAGDNYSKLKNWGQSETHLRKAINVNEQNFYPFLLLGENLYYQNKLESAQDNLNRALQLAPNHSKAKHLLKLVDLKKRGTGSTQ